MTKKVVQWLGMWLVIFTAPLALFYGLNKEIAVFDAGIFLYWYGAMAFVTGVIFSIFFAVHKVFKIKNIKYFAGYTLFILFAFIWLHINLDGVIKDTYLFLLWVFICAVAAWKTDIFVKFSQILSIIFIAQGGMALFATQELKEPIKTLQINHKTNVYHYLNDGYAGLESLKRTEDFDNSAIYTYLEKQGFKAYKNPLSNYPRTYITMTGYFRMQYFSPEALGSYNKNTTTIMGVDDALFRGCNETFLTYFKYNYIIRATRSVPFRPCGESSISFQPKDAEWTKLYFNKFVKEEIFKTKTSNTSFAFAEGNQVIEQAKAATIDIKNGKKAFTYLHSHPLAHRAGCVSYDVDLTKKDFACMYENKNNEIKELVKEINKADKDAIVILSSDHGAGQSSIDRKNLVNKDRLAMFLAVRWNKACKSYNNIPQKNMHPVNVYKYVFGCQQGKKWQDVEILPYYGFLRKKEAYNKKGFEKDNKFYIIETPTGTASPAEFVTAIE